MQKNKSAEQRHIINLFVVFMRDTTMCLVIDKENKRILLGMKKIGFGRGKFNGFGGKVETGEKIKDAAIRELYEESNLEASPEYVTKMAELTFVFPFVKNNEWDQVMHVFLASEWNGKPQESNEMSPIWKDVDNLPLDKMWADDSHWLPLVLQGKKIRGKFIFKEDNETIKEFTMNIVDELGT